MNSGVSSVALIEEAIISWSEAFRSLTEGFFA